MNAVVPLFLLLGFAVPMVLAWTLDRAARRPRSGPAGAIDVIAFNAWPFILGPVAAVVAGVAALAPVPLVLRVLLGIGAVAAALASVSAYVAVVWVFEVGARGRWVWIARAAGSPRRWINITTGFDDSTAILEATVQETGWVADVFDPSLDHEAALRRARARFPPAVGPQRVEDLASALEPTSYDAVFLLMSAHEARGADRLALFELVERLLAVQGRLLLVEHLRDTANSLAFGPGAQHFQTRATWLEASARAGLRLTSELNLTPFVRGFVFERATDR